jgi:hypothetical protein
MAFPLADYLRHKRRMDLDRSGSASEVSVTVEVLSQACSTPAQLTSPSLSILD